MLCTAVPSKEIYSRPDPAEDQARIHEKDSFAGNVIGQIKTGYHQQHPENEIYHRNIQMKNLVVCYVYQIVNDHQAIGPSKCDGKIF
jgi:hypothetical protein